MSHRNTAGGGGIITPWCNYAIVARVDKQDPDYQTSLFLGQIGLEALKIYNNFELGNQSRNLDSIIEAFNKFSIGEINETYESYVFNKRYQQGEKFESFLGACISIEKKNPPYSCPSL